MKKVLVVFVGLLCSCAPVVQIKKSDMVQPKTVLVITEGGKPAALLGSGTAGGMAMFGILGGIVGGVIESTINRPRQLLLDRAVGHWDFPSHIELEFISKVRIPAWNFVLASKSLTPEESSQVLKFVKNTETPPPPSKQKDRGDAEKENAAVRAKMNQIKTMLLDKKIDSIIHLNCNFMGIFGYVGDEDYRTQITANMVALGNSSQIIWSRMVDSEKRPEAKQTRIDYKKENSKESPEIKTQLMARTQFVIDTLAKDFD